MLERQVTYEQRQATRRQVLETDHRLGRLGPARIAGQAAGRKRPAPRNPRNAAGRLHRRADPARQNELLQQQISMTRQALKEHFVLDKIATQEKLRSHSARQGR